MRIELIALNGLLRFTDPVALDLRELPPGLIAIVGENGSGKTTLLESAIAAFYRRFASRGDRPLVDYALDRDAFLDVSFSIDGQGAYRARVNLDALTRSSDAVLEQLQPDGSRAILTDGKVTTYDEAIAERLPSQDVLLASAFSAQNKAGNFIGKKPRERKDLFAELLGLQHYETMSATARQAAALVEGTRGRLQAMRSIIARDAGDDVGAAIDRDAQVLAAAGETAATMKRALRAELDGLEARLAAVQQSVAAYMAASHQAEQLTGELVTRQSERGTLTLQRAAADRQLTDERQRLNDKRATDLADIASRVAANAQLQRQAATIRAAVAAIAALDEHLTGHRARLERDRTALAVDERALFAAHQALERLTAVDAELARTRSDAHLLDDVPCGGSGPFASCRFLTNARQAVTRIPTLEERIAARPQVEETAAECRATYEARALAIDQLVATIADLDRQKREHQTHARYAEKLAAAEARLAELADKRRRVEDDAARLEREAHARHAARIHELQQQAARLDARIDQLQAERLAAQQTMAAHDPARAEAFAVQTDLAAARTAWDDVIASIAQVDAGVQALDRRRDALAAKRAQLAAIDAKLAPLEPALVDWQRLAQAFGRTGLPVLEIDAAGPTISAYTNELLQVCYGARFTVELVTEQARADGKGMRESFTVNVFDNVRGGETREISDLSGGEQSIVAEALMAAIGAYVNTRSLVRLQTFWRDEVTGALDDANAERYVLMLRRLCELAGIHHCFYVTHNATCAAMADAQIQVADGRASIVLPPFEAAA